MNFEVRLSPPIIENKLNAFSGTKLIVPFTISKAVSPVDFDTVLLKIKSVQTNEEKITALPSKRYQFNYNTQQYEAHFDLSSTDFVPLVGQYYKVQIALYNSAPTREGYYSTVGIIKHTSEPKVQIKELINGKTQHVYEYTGLYQQEGDMTEKVYSYCFNLYNDGNSLVATSGEIIHDNSKDTDSYQSTDTWSVRKNLEPNVHYEIEYVVTTVNGLTKSSGRYQIIESETKAPNLHSDLYADNMFEDGYIRVRLVGDKTSSLVTGRFILMRCSSEDNFQSWYELTRFDLSQWDSNSTITICKDYTVKQGIEYIYAVRAYNSLGLFSDRVPNINGVVKCDFEDIFLFDGERQLKVRFNPKVTSFKSNILESKMDTIGGTFPFFFRNGNVTYKEFPISGLISLCGDENDEFLSGLSMDISEPRDDFKHTLSRENIKKEREFKLMVLDWLTNGQPKLFRSPTEGNYIVRLMNTSLTPNDTLGRMLHTFTCTAYEVAEYTFENLKAFGFAVDDYVEMRTLRMNQINLNDIPKELINKEDNSVKLPSAVFVSITANPFTLFEYTLTDGAVKSEQLVSTGTFIFPQEVLVNNPMISVRLLSDSWGKKAYLTYGYHDIAADTFSVIHNIINTDEVMQITGKGMSSKDNLITELEDLHQKTGAFHFIRVQPRDTIKIYAMNGSYYFNNSGSEVTALNPNAIYHIYNSLEHDAQQSGYYFDGRDRYINEKNKKRLEELDYRFHISGMKQGEFVDFTGNENTTGRYEALTNLNMVDEIYAGDGLILDIVYQKKEILYVVEVIDNEHYDYKTGQAKASWESDLEYYNSLIGQNASATLIAAWAEKVANSYSNYLYWLEQALKSIEEEYGVEYAL